MFGPDTSKMHCAIVGPSAGSDSDAAHEIDDVRLAKPRIWTAPLGAREAGVRDRMEEDDISLLRGRIVLDAPSAT